MKKPLVSVITVVFNGAATLEATIRSVADQTFRDLEYIIVDGGSKDATIDIIKRHPDTITRWISERDKGVYDAMNKGIRLAEGEWLYFLGSDDSFQDALVLAGFFAAPGAIGLGDGSGAPDIFTDPGVAGFDLLYGDVLSPSYKGRYDGEFTYEKLLSRNLSHQAAFYKKSLFTRLGDYDQHYRMHADWDFNLRCFSDAAVRTRYTGVLVATFGAEGISAGHDLAFLRERLIPAKLQWLEQTGYQTLRGLRLYDEWWRFLRNAGARDSAVLGRPVAGVERSGRASGAIVLPAPLQSMLAWQRVLPEKLLNNGVISKCWMFASYLINRVTASI
ncbi:MAG TPA: glycosyltransferase family 2 protein [Puia sp.]|jgi:glycosyltransferase involved in cell wall biosynthesis